MSAATNWQAKYTPAQIQANLRRKAAQYRMANATPQSKHGMSLVEAECMNGLISAGGAFVTVGALSDALGRTDSSIKTAIRNMEERLSAEIPQRVWIEHKYKHGFYLYGVGIRIMELWLNAHRAIADDLGASIAHREASKLIVRER